MMLFFVPVTGHPGGNFANAVPRWNKRSFTGVRLKSW